VKRDPISGIRVLASEVDYSDGAEDRLLEILDRAGDLGSLSDELAAAIDDWPTRYHLARERSNLLRPLAIDHRHRVLEIGAGGGAISRHLGETGARVVALEGSLTRARVAAARCRDLDNVEVVCGALESFEDGDGFDLVCIIGVLEYAGAGAAAFLRSAAAHLRPTGTLVLAIENQIGLKYLIGYDEDHLGRPWVGLEGYVDADGVRTYSRRRLKKQLDDTGLAVQRWFYPFPDYKMASVIVSQSAYDERDAANFIDQVVRDPVGAGESPPMLLCDDRRVHRVMLEAGLGPDVANSFLVLASAEPGDHPGDPDPHTIAWFYGGQRRRCWIRHQVVETIAGGRRIRSHGPGDLSTPRGEAWLRQDPRNDQEFIIGATIRDQATAACRKRDAEALGQVLGLWRQTVDDARSEAVPGDGGNPFLLEDTREVLPPDYLDLVLSNFIVSDDGVDFIDREWIADPAVDADLVSVRGLWLLAQDLVRGGGIHPWDPGLTVDELTIELGRLADLPAAEVLDHLHAAEAELLHLVTGRPAKSIRADLEWFRSFRPTAPEAIRSMPLSRLRDQLDAVRADLANLGVERRERARLEVEVAHERRTVEQLAAELGAAHERLAETGASLEEVAAALHRATAETARLEGRLAEADDIRRELTGLRAEYAVLKGWKDAFERRAPVRLWRKLQRFFEPRH
jgi:SAM-dependent methyltransferase